MILVNFSKCMRIREIKLVVVFGVLVTHQWPIVHLFDLEMRLPRNVFVKIVSVLRRILFVVV